MPSSLRVHANCKSYFFTVSLRNRRSDLLVREIDALRASYVSVQRTRPFTCNAFVVLPDHLHAVWTLPPCDDDVSTRWRILKAQFTSRVRQGRAASGGGTPGKGARQWRRLFQQHQIIDKSDFTAHLEYCWINPVRHGLATHPCEWPYSSLHRDIKRGEVPASWSGGEVIAKDNGLPIASDDHHVSRRGLAPETHRLYQCGAALSDHDRWGS